MLKLKSYRTGKNEKNEDFLQLEMVITIPVKKENGIEYIQLSSFLVITADDAEYYIVDDEDEDQKPETKSIYQKSLFV